MITLRTAVLLGLAVVATACSGNIGGGQSTLPGGPQTTNGVQPAGLPAPTPTPVSASNVATVGDNITAQALPAVAGWGGSITFAKPSPAPSPQASGVPASISVGVTAGIVGPADAPALGVPESKRRHAAGKADGSPRGIFYISLLATSDFTLGETPKIAVDVPRDVMERYRDDTFGLALFDPETKLKAYALAVAERDLSSPPAALVSSTPPTPAPTPTLNGEFGGGTSSFTPPPVGTGLDMQALPPARVSFSASAGRLMLKANRPVVFALYVLAPSPSPSPAPNSSGAASAEPNSAGAASATPAAPMPSAARVASPRPTPTPAP